MNRLQSRRRWYSVSVETLRSWGVLAGLVVAVAVGFFGYRYWWDSFGLRRQAVQVVEEVGILFQRVEAQAAGGPYEEELETARESWQRARQELVDENPGAAIEEGRRSRAMLLSILDNLGQRGAAGEAQFVSVQGEVEYRRGEAGGWQEARGRVVLRAGDYIRTGGGSAEIMFVDGTLYNIRPNTQVVIARQGSGEAGDERSVSMQYGWVNLNTAKNPSRVDTPGAVARVDQDSETFVAYERESKTGRFGAFRGGLAVTARDGERRRVGALEQVVQNDRAISQPIPLPAQPELLEPADNTEVNIERVEELKLAWRPVPAARRYALQISESHLFVDNVIDVENRTKTQATLGVRGEGVFLWRVAAVGEDGARGVWSDPRRFRVASFAGGDGDDRTPPELELLDVTSYGNIFIVEGRTESGASVAINDEPVKVAADGSFTKTIQLTREGWTSVDVRAQDPWGNESRLSHPVFVESP